MDIPESVVRVPVVGSLLRVVLDSRDLGSVPNARELPNLRAVVEATVPYLEVGADAMYIMDRLVFHTNQVGEIVNTASPDDAPEVPATTGNGPDFLYQVQLLWDGQTEKQKNLFLWRATAAESLNLGRVINAPTPEEIPGWMQTLAEVEAVRTEIQGLLTQTQGHASAAQGQAVAAEASASQAMAYRDQAGAIAAGEVIDDAVTSPNMAWSSQKVSGEIARHDHTIAVIQKPLRNLVTNPSFETGTLNWGGSGVTITASTGYNRSGKVGGQHLNVFANGTANAFTYTTIQLPTEADFFAARAMIGQSTGAPFARMSILFRNGSAAVAYRHGVWTELSSSSLEPFTAVEAVPAGVDNARILIYPAGDASGGAPEAGGRTLVDAVMAATGGSADTASVAWSPYFDGDSPGGWWEGTPHGSVSGWSPLGIDPDRLSGVVDGAETALLGATTTRRGVVELATPSEAAAGTDTQRAVTPAGVLAVLESRPANTAGSAAAFGAVGDGVTDDTAAIRAWLEAGGGILEPGTYAIGNVVLARDGVVVEGMGAKLMPQGTSITVTGDRLYVRGLEIDGSNGGYRGINATGSAGTIQDCYIHDMGSSSTNGMGIVAGINSGNWRIANNRFERFTSPMELGAYTRAIGISADNAVDRSFIEGNQIVDVIGGEGDGITVHSARNSVDDDALFNDSWVVVRNNSIKNCSRRFVKVQASNTVIDGNIMDDDGLTVYERTQHGLNILYGQYNQVINNEIINHGFTSVISVSGWSTNRALHNVVKDNIVSSVSANGGVAITVTDQQNLIVTGNITKHHLRGLNVMGGFNILVEGNLNMVTSPSIAQSIDGYALSATSNAGGSVQNNVDMTPNRPVGRSLVTGGNTLVRLGNNSSAQDA